MARPRIIGLLGGSFNPAHRGHLHISREAIRALGLDEVWWLVSPQNPLKSRTDMAAFEQRYTHAQQLARSCRQIRVSDIEQQLGKNYTVDTLRVLRAAYPQVRFVWLMGADNLAQFHRWHQWQEIFGLIHIAVYDRRPPGISALASPAARRFRRFRITPRALTSASLPAWCFIHGTRHPLSATFMRNLLGDAAFLRHNE